jgi:ABC-2 type transport system ATP-binding protein
MTVLSRRILAEGQEVSDTVGILRAGLLLYQGTHDNLLVGKAVPAYRVRLRAPVERAVERLRGEEWVTGVVEDAGGTLRVGVRSLTEAELRLPQSLAACGARVVSVEPQAADLEDVFLELTS